ncbi:MAG TPA: hypothetical protein VE987_05435 [Polyangiaceae bacterium]|nr:hypothetical protein [Polyangiaceae bacterium]
MDTASIRSLAIGFALGALSVAVPAHADVSDADAARIASAGHTLEWNWTPPGRSDRFGHGETLIHAPIEAVRRVVLDFSKYKDLPPNSIKTSRVVGHAADGSTDVYFQIGVLNDILTFWNVTRFAPLRRAADGVEIVEGRMLPGKGNIDDAALVWTMHSAGGDWTVLKFDVVLRPSLPAPQSVIDHELRESARNTVDSVRDQLQSAKGILPYTG